MPAGTLPRRILFSAVAIPAALALAYVGGWAFAALIAAVALLGVHEGFAFGALQGLWPLGWVARPVFAVAYAAARPAFAIALRPRLGPGPRNEPLAGTVLLFF